MKHSLQDWLERMQARHPRAIELGLERVGAVWQRMGIASIAPCVITVGGTNGKGSTVAFIETIARASGLRVGAYTSPHLLRYNERVRIDGMEVSDDALVQAFEAVEAARGDTALTFFETGTLAALWLFAQAELDLAVLEVGLGGRLDAVNLIDADVAVITMVDLDHMDWLGADREAIGAEKVGIARAWKPLVLGDDDPPASVLRHAYAIGASSWRIGCDFFIDPLDAANWRYREAGFEMTLPKPALAAPVQLRNAAVAIAALRASPLAINSAAWAEGLGSASVAGRLQHLQRKGVDFWLDVAHNPQAASALAQWLQAAPRSGRVLALYAALADKDAAGVVRALAPQVERWHLAGLDVTGRGQTADSLAKQIASVVDGSVQHATVAAGLDAIFEEAQPGDTVLVFGSFHTVEEALRQLGSAPASGVGAGTPV